MDTRSPPTRYTIFILPLRRQGSIGLFQFRSVD